MGTGWESCPLPGPQGMRQEEQGVSAPQSPGDAGGGMAPVAASSFGDTGTARPGVLSPWWCPQAVPAPKPLSWATPPAPRSLPAPFLFQEG